MRSTWLSSVFLFLASSLLIGCGSGDSRPCASRRVWVDSLGEQDERSRIQVQWARFQGKVDSLASSLEGKTLMDRAAGSLERNEVRYLDSIDVVGGQARSMDGCVDWSASWALGSFDRQAMATVLLRRMLPDTGFGAVEFRLDTTKSPMELEVDASPSVPSVQEGLRTVRFGIDSLGMRTLEP
jgi:hypothetical protein